MAHSQARPQAAEEEKGGHAAAGPDAGFCTGREVCLVVVFFLFVGAGKAQGEDSGEGNGSILCKH